MDLADDTDEALRARIIAEPALILEDGRVLDVENVIWCTGFEPDFSWIDLPEIPDNDEPKHDRGVVADVPGLYFVGLEFLYSMASVMIQGAGRDARYIVDRIAERTPAVN